jgi:hypothetical protein
MESQDQHNGARGDSDFAHRAASPQTGFLSEFWSFLRWNKKWWLAPLVATLLLLGVLALLGGSPATAFIYALF